MSGAEGRRLGLALAEASDGALARVVAMLDGVAERATADQLLNTARPRLRQLRPPRPLQMARLLFLPLDAVIQPPGRWRRGDGGLPRNALAAIATQIRLSTPADWADVAAEAAGQRFDDQAAVGRVGRRLWHLAQRTARPLRPTDWSEATGLRRDDYGPLMSLCTGVWQQAGPLWIAIEAAGHGPPEALVRATLEPAVRAGEPVFAACLALLLQRAASPATVATVAGALGKAAELLTEAALDAFIAEALPVLDARRPAQAADAASHAARILDDLDQAPVCRERSRRQSLQRLRHASDLACRSAFTTAVENQILEPMSRFAGQATDTEVEGLEQAARDLRRLEQAGRRLGGTAAYAQGLRDAEQHLAGLRPMPGGLTQVDIARVVEILCGSEAAGRFSPGRGFGTGPRS